MNTIIRILIVAGLIAGIYYLVIDDRKNPESTQTEEESTDEALSNNPEENAPLTPSPEGDDSVILNEDQGNTSGTHLSGTISLPQEKATWTVSYDNTGFSPRTLSIKKGDTVRFVNNSNEDMWVASNPHPAHSDLAGFDAGRAYISNEIYTYTFTQQGTWNYHNDIHSSLEGSVVVK